MTKDQTSAHKTIPLEKFAKRIAGAVSRFLDVRSIFFGTSAVVVVIFIFIWR
jgi:hypothetical protein